MRGAPAQGSKKLLYQVVKVNPGLCWRCQSWKYLPRRARVRVWKQPRQRSVLQSTKQEGIGVLKNACISDIKMQNVEFAWLCFSLPLVQYFLTMLPFLPIGMGI